MEVVWTSKRLVSGGNGVNLAQRLSFLAKMDVRSANANPQYYRQRCSVRDKDYFREFFHYLAVAWVLLLCGCVTNPVTGKQEVGFVSTAQQISVGEEQYEPAQQMQGGLYTVDEDLDRYVSEVGNKVAKYTNIDLPYEFVVLNSSVPNAWALPGGKVAINRGLLVALRNEAELAAVLGHEVVHAAARHGAKQMERSLLLQSALAVTALSAEGTPVADSLMQSAQMAANMVNQKYGRDAERESDYYGMRILVQAGYDPYAAVTLQETFLKLSQSNQVSWMDGLLSSHPPSAERVANNKALLETLKSEGYSGGEYGSARFQAATRILREDAPAYKAADDARKLMLNGELDEAIELIDSAIARQNKEPKFHSLKGEIRYRQDRYRDAEINFNRAIERYSGYYAPYLGRGMTRSAANERSAAKADLQRSIELLPTTIAYLELGKIAEAEGNTEAAARYYRAAGQ